MINKPPLINRDYYGEYWDNGTENGSYYSITGGALNRRGLINHGSTLALGD